MLSDRKPIIRPALGSSQRKPKIGEKEVPARAPALKVWLVLHPHLRQTELYQEAESMTNLDRRLGVRSRAPLVKMGLEEPTVKIDGLMLRGLLLPLALRTMTSIPNLIETRTCIKTPDSTLLTKLSILTRSNMILVLHILCLQYLTLEMTRTQRTLPIHNLITPCILPMLAIHPNIWHHIPIITTRGSFHISPSIHLPMDQGPLLRMSPRLRLLPS